MNRQEAADFLDKCRWWFEPYTSVPEKWNEAIDLAIEVLQDDWIPVSERLPDNRKEVLVYLSTGRMTIANYNEHKLPFSDKAIGWGYSPINGKIDFAKEDVIAWMPLPEPYRRLFLIGGDTE